MPIYIDESGSLPAGAMIMAGVEIEADAADRLLARFRAVVGLRGELKGSRIGLVERAFFFELLDRFDARAKICIIRADPQDAGRRPEDLDVYVALLTQLVDEWRPDAEEDCLQVFIDAGRYDTLVLESVRQDIAKRLARCGSAQMIDSRRSAGVQIADVVANSFYNIAIRSGRSGRIETIVEPFLTGGVLQTSDLRHRPGPRAPHPVAARHD
ncbi:DUF3800 domain-containing protein [Sphingobium sp. B11D3D]|uniref:DUF3800 domain-containing protein n=1 Tax=Sphingobium sp. B11D3D TaxID=2940576 RepID=UPI0022250F50|nr:DUF3800 domain-containing protein [Sphingobium sp. B11D3D]